MARECELEERILVGFVVEVTFQSADSPHAHRHLSLQRLPLSRYRRAESKSNG